MNPETEKGTEERKTMPEEFSKIIKDFVSDIQITFPEMQPLIKKWWKDSSTFSYIENEQEREQKYLEAQEQSIKFLFAFVQKKVPPRFFDILYQNEEMFQADSTVDTEFLPHIHFKNLWEFDISEKTRSTIWKYLQLLMFTVVGSLENKEAFGDCAKLFEEINQDEFRTKLEETMAQMQDLFEMNMDGTSASEGEEPTFTMPNPENIQEHISGMLDGKLGRLAKEIAEETAAEFNMDMENASDMKDVLQNMMKNPTKLMGLVKNVGDKLDSRLKSGEIKESELISEAAEMMNKMKNMPGMENIQSMLSKMVPGLGKNVKVNTGAMEAQMNRNLKTAQMKERMKAKAEAHRQAQALSAFNVPMQTPLQPNPNALTDEELIAIFSTGEKVERTPRNAQPNNDGSAKKKKKKAKK